MPVGIKDIIETIDMPTEQGSPLFAGFRSDPRCRERRGAARGRRRHRGQDRSTTEFAATEPRRHPQSA